MITLDGSHGEGGGALVRVALALSTLTDQPFHITNIRANRPQAGLKAQHLASIHALKQISNAQTNDIQLGSTELIFTPGKIRGGKYEFDIGTAGSITLFLQAIILPCLFAPSKITLTIKGGTSGKWQASVDYLQHLLLPQLHRFVEKINLKIIKRGYYPEGGGEIILEISPKYHLKDYSTFQDFSSAIQQKIPPIHLTNQYAIEQIRGLINLSQQLEEKKVAERIKAATELNLQNYNVPLSIRMEYVNTKSIGGELVLWAICSTNKTIDDNNQIILAGDALLEKNKSSEDVAKEAVLELKQSIDQNACVDHHLADQLIMFMALLPSSEIKCTAITPHTLTNISITETFLPVKFEIEGNNIKTTTNQKDL